MASHITKADASFLIGQTVIDYSYKPTVGLITQPWRMVSTRWLTDKSVGDTTMSSRQFGQLALNSPRWFVSGNRLRYHRCGGKFSEYIRR